MSEDTRGAVMVLGIVMGTLLVGALWHVASIGDGVIWREQAQNAADAAAFENAVWNARGMNVIVAINIVMSAVLAILVIWRTVMILAAVALVASALLCFFTAGVGCGFTAAVVRMETWMASKDTQVATNIVRVLTGMNAAQIGIATATPVVGFFRAPASTEDHYRLDSAFAYSSSLLPSVNVKGAQRLINCVKGFKGGRAPSSPKPTTAGGKAYADYLTYVNQPRMGFGVSLPVQKEDYSALCDKAGQFVLNNLAGVLERANVPSGAISAIDSAKGVIGMVTSSLPGLFCSPIGTASGDDVLPLLHEAGKKACGAELEGRRRMVSGKETELMYQDDDGELLNEKDFRKKCEKRKEDEANQKMAKAAKSAYEFAECGSPAKVWEWAVNGNLFMRSFATVEKPTEMLRRNDQGLEVADQAATGSLLAAAPQEIDAHAEMYFDCADTWSKCKKHAMWQLRWRARLRRVQPMENLLQSAIEPALVSTLANALKEGVGAQVQKRADAAGSTTFTIPQVWVPKVKDTYPFRWAKHELMVDGYSSGAFEAVGSFLITNASGDGTVH